MEFMVKLMSELCAERKIVIQEEGKQNGHIAAKRFVLQKLERVDRILGAASSSRVN